MKQCFCPNMAIIDFQKGTYQCIECGCIMEWNNFRVPHNIPGEIDTSAYKRQKVQILPVPTMLSDSIEKFIVQMEEQYGDDK